ncbi:MAG: flagellar basal-body MS-ring/collar protein FliF [Pseudomonadota bacterium]
MAATENNTTERTNSGSLTERLSEVLVRMSNQQKVMVLVALALVIALFVASSAWLKSADYRVLFSNISERDGGAIIAALEQLNIPYRFNDGGSAILVPGDKVHEVRLRLASQGLPKGGAVGFELMEGQKFGTSQFAEQVNYQRGLEGELARTIQSIAAVQMARVHLAIPKPTVFMREEQKPSASVLLYLHPGRALEAAQVAGIQNLVAASVPQLPVANVTLLDQSGMMLSQLKNKTLDSGLDPTQIKYIQEIEASVIKRIEDILSPIVGAGNARVQVAADIDFAQSEQTAESHRPNTTPPEISIRSQQISESSSPAATAVQGVPGALSNQPAEANSAPIQTPPAAPGAGAGNPNQAAQLNVRKDSTINYEVDKTIRHTKDAVGMIKRLSAAVVVNHRKDGEKSKPLADTEIKQINELVKEAMGFSKERGDTLSVANAPFTISEKNDDSAPIWKDPELLFTLKELLKYLAIAGIIAYLMLGVLRPFFKTMLEALPRAEPSNNSNLNAIIADGAGNSSDPAEPSSASSLNKKLEEARKIAQQDPRAVANIIQGWSNSDGG